MVLKISVNVDAWQVVHERLLCFLFWNVVYTFTYICKYHNPCKSKTIKIVVPWNLLIVNSYYKWRLFIQKTIEVVAFEGPQGKPSYKIATYNSQILGWRIEWWELFVRLACRGPASVWCVWCLSTATSSWWESWAVLTIATKTHKHIDKNIWWVYTKGSKMVIGNIAPFLFFWGGGYFYTNGSIIWSPQCNLGVTPLCEWNLGCNFFGQESGYTGSPTPVCTILDAMLLFVDLFHNQSSKPMADRGPPQRGIRRICIHVMWFAHILLILSHISRMTWRLHKLEHHRQPHANCIG